MQSGVENQLGRIKQRRRFMSRSSGARRFMQKVVEDQLSDATSRKMSNQGLVALGESCKS